MLRSFLFRALLSMAAVIAFACSALASEPSWMDGEWIADVETLINETFPEATPEFKAQVIAETKERVLSTQINSAERVVIVKTPDGDVRLDITSFEPQSDGTVKVVVRDGQKGSERKNIWKRLSEDKIEMIVPDGNRILYTRKQP